MLRREVIQARNQRDQVYLRENHPSEWRRTESRCDSGLAPELRPEDSRYPSREGLEGAHQEAEPMGSPQDEGGREGPRQQEIQLRQVVTPKVY